MRRQCWEEEKKKKKANRFQERQTRINLACVKKSDEFFKNAYKECQKEQKAILAEKLDIIQLREYYEKIAQLIGEQKLDLLNEKLKDNFFIAPPMKAFTQGYMNEVLYFLTERDKETGKEILRLI